MNDIVKQARQGSVAAIIQVLNEKLADSGVRTRAILADGILQLLCEAARVDQLEQSILIEHIRQILESIAPRNIRRVNINSRIVREQQLLWLEEIQRDPENQLLWSEEITLAKPNLFKQLEKNLKASQTNPKKTALPKSSSSRLIRQKPQFSRGIIGGACLFLFLLLFGWVVHDWLGAFLRSLQAQTPKSPESTTSQKNVLAQSEKATQTDEAQTTDSFAAAVRIANQASAVGKTAQSSAQWLDLAARWQRASDLMKAVPANHSRYQEAQIRTKLYRKYSEAAEQEAQKTPS